MSAHAAATDLREALIAETLDEVVRLHDAVQAIGPTLQAAVADATVHGKKGDGRVRPGTGVIRGTNDAPRP